MASDIVERLRNGMSGVGDGDEANELMDSAAAELTRLRAEVADLERKLETSNDLLGRCRPAVAVLRKMIETAGLTSEAVAAALFEDVKTHTDAAGLGKGA